MRRTLIIALSLLLAVPAFCQEEKITITQQEWDSIPPALQEKIVRWMSQSIESAISLEKKEQTGGWMLEDGRYLYYESDFFLQLSRDREIPPDGNYVYSRWSDMTDVDAVYVSREMYEMLGTLPKISIRGRKLDLSGVIQELKGLYLLDFARYRKSDPKVRYCRNGQRVGLRWDIRNFLEQNHYTTLMDMREDGQYTRLYIASEGNTVTGFVVVCLDDAFDYGRYVCLEGRMPKDKFQALIKKTMK